MASPRGRVQEPDGDGERPSPISPYPPRYLEVERFATGQRAAEVDGLLDESNHPRYNPDLPDPDHGALSAIRGRVSTAALA